MARLGPDALDESVHWRDILTLLLAPQFQRRTLAALYLDQGFVAGIGNYLRSEILFEARVNPFDRPCDLSRRQLGRLAQTTLDLTRQSLATAGITTNPLELLRPNVAAEWAALPLRHLRSSGGALVTAARARLSALMSAVGAYIFAKAAQPTLRPISKPGVRQ
ncbi:MAG: hypothetical protein CM15mP120_28450 [Pseudomonadota bacterium]|nr:MAG: hypothetical protein CM15mP120_28450 [Pseudomonadota bacterium]